MAGTRRSTRERKAEPEDTAVGAAKKPALSKKTPVKEPALSKTPVKKHAAKKNEKLTASSTPAKKLAFRKTPAKKRGEAAVTVTPTKKSRPTTATTSVLLGAPNDVVAAPAPKRMVKSHPVDPDIAIQCQRPADYQVVQSSTDNGLWFDAVLNQCNISGNNNKYYRLQMVKSGANDNYFVWFRWGRVGESSRASSSTWSGPYSSEPAAEKVFSKKYYDKSGNVFGAENFVEKKGKYAPVEVDNDVDVGDEFQAQRPAVHEEISYLKSALDPKTKALVEVLFSKEMRNEALSSFNLDLRKLPLGVPSKSQIQHGVSILSEIEDKLSGSTSSSTFEELSSRFYTAIPHSFGRSRPPVVASTEALQSRYDMCNILLDMYETTATISRIERETRATTMKFLPNPIDQHYNSLQADLVSVEASSEESRLIRLYFDTTKASGSRARLLDIWSVNRLNEAQRFAAFDKVDNRRLLWHGTNIAVVAPIITCGLRIMPHSGGRVGAGIYLANLQQKSAQYTSGYGRKFACMFLCEAPLGKQHEVDRDGPHASGLRKAPNGFDSVHAVGCYRPTIWAPLKLDGKAVAVPSSAPVPSGVQSAFSHDEFLVYNESQVRLRYVVTVELS